MVKAIHFNSTIGKAGFFALVYFFAALAALVLTKGASGIASVWPASGIMLAGSLLLKKPERTLLFAGGFVGSLIANMTIGASLWVAFAFSVANIVEVIAAHALISRFCDKSRHIAAPKNIGCAAVSAVLAALVSALTATILSFNFSGEFFLSWSTTVFFGMTTIAPAILFLVSDRARLTIENQPQFVTILAGVTAASGCAFFYGGQPILWIPMAASGYATYRLGLSGAAISLLILALASAVFSVTDTNIALGGPFMGERTLFLQVYLMGVLASILPIATLLEDHRATVLALNRSREKAELNAILFRSASEKDSLTGVMNRSKILGDLEAAIEEATEDETPLSVLMIDVDHFKQINDRFGHAAGDRALTIVAQTIASVAPQDTEIGRIGGEEFLQILRGYSLVEAAILAENIREKIKNVDWDTQEIAPITLSIGIATYTQGMSRRSLLASADDQLYRAKNSGRDQIRAAA